MLPLFTSSAPPPDVLSPRPIAVANCPQRPIPGEPRACGLLRSGSGGAVALTGASAGAAAPPRRVPVGFTVNSRSPCMTSGSGGGSLVVAPAVVLPRCGHLTSRLPDAASASPADKSANLLAALTSLGSRRRGLRGRSLGASWRWFLATWGVGLRRLSRTGVHDKLRRGAGEGRERRGRGRVRRRGFKYRRGSLSCAIQESPWPQCREVRP